MHEMSKSIEARTERKRCCDSLTTSPATLFAGFSSRVCVGITVGESRYSWDEVSASRQLCWRASLNSELHFGYLNWWLRVVYLGKCSTVWRVIGA